MIKQLFLFFLLIGATFSSFAKVECFDIEPQKAKKMVYDSANLLSQNERISLENKLYSYSKETSAQIAIVAVNKVTCDMAMTAISLGHEWGVGQEKEDNGIVILIAKENRKVYIATGYGVEGYIPDIYAKRIIDNIITPNFKKGNFYGGLSQALDIMADMLKGVYQPKEEHRTDSDAIPLWVIVLIILIVFLLMSRGNRGGGSQYDYDSNGRRVFGDDWGQNSGNWGDFRGGRGVFFPPSGGGFGGGGSGGGGFGGFGGGGFGGGGAGGSW